MGEKLCQYNIMPPFKTLNEVGRLRAKNHSWRRALIFLDLIFFSPPKPKSHKIWSSKKIVNQIFKNISRLRAAEFPPAKVRNRYWWKMHLVCSTYQKARRHGVYTAHRCELFDCASSATSAHVNTPSEYIGVSPAIAGQNIDIKYELSFFFRTSFRNFFYFLKLATKTSCKLTLGDGCFLHHKVVSRELSSSATNNTCVNCSTQKSTVFVRELGWTMPNEMFSELQQHGHIVKFNVRYSWPGPGFEILVSDCLN